MTTFSTLQTSVRNYLGDTTSGAYTWTADQIKLFIQNAIADYSIYFPRRLNTSLDAAAGSRTYNLPYNVHGIISVEYQPLGVSSTPRTFYRRMDSLLAVFYQSDKVYDWIKNDISSAALQPPTLTVNPVSAADADTYSIEYNGDHTLPVNDNDVITVPDRHANILNLYIRWQAIQELSTGAKRLTIIAPGSINLATAVPFNEMDLKRTMDAYHRAITQALKAESESVQAQWQRQGEGQIY